MPSPSGISVKSLGLIAATLLSIIFIVIIILSMTQGSPTPPKQGVDLFPNDPNEIPNIDETQTGGAMLVTMVDKDDPTRIAATLQADRFEPMGEGRRRLDNPESWIYLQDGRAIKIVADYATMLMPDPNQAPESGTLEGNIVIETYPQTPTPGNLALSDATPTMIARFDDPVEFERRYLRLRSTGHFEIESDRIDFSGTDLTVILNDLRDRVELIDVAQGDRLVIHGQQPDSELNAQNADPITEQPIAQPPTNSPAGASPTERSAQAPSTPVQSTADLLNHYHITLENDVVTEITDSGSASADTLEVWTTLIGSSLPDDAIKNIKFVRSSSTPAESKTVSPPTQQTSQQASITQPSQSTTTESTTPSDVIITWSGPMTVRPIDDQLPAQLDNNKLAIKLSSDESIADSRVIFDAPQHQFTGHAHSVTYLATRAVLELESTSTQGKYQAQQIELQAQGSGSLNASSISADLSTGIVTLPGRGQIVSTQGGQDPLDHASIQWKENAQFEINTDSNSITDRLNSARFRGSVVAKQSGNSVGALSMEASFDPALPNQSSLTKLSLEQGVLSSANKSLLSGNSVDINFKPGSQGDPIEPTSFVAIGQAIARNSESMLRTEQLSATLYRDLAGDISVQTADAQGSIRYSGPDQTTARGNSLNVDGVNEIITLKGIKSTMTQGGSKIVGDHINLNAKRRAIQVVGPGSFDHDIALDQTTTINSSIPIAKGHIRATWTGSMNFDDSLGSIICEDDVKVISTPDAFTRDTLEAHRAQIKLTPNPTTDPISSDQIAEDSTAQQSAERELISARIFGHAPIGEEPIPAKIESRTYDQNDPERVIGLLYLDGSQILADNQSQTLDVPSPGTLLILDRSESDEEQQDSATLTPAGQGLTRFTWKGSMNLNRANGTAHFEKSIIVRQKTMSTGQIATLSTNTLDAQFEIGKQADDAQSQSAQAQSSTRLISAQALGSVRFLYQQRELLADSAIYDAIEDSLFASAIDNKLVTVYEESQPAPLSARTIKWDLTQDRVEINAPSPTRGTGG